MAIIEASKYKVVLNEEWSNFNDFLETKTYSKIFVLVDENTEEACLPILAEVLNKPFEKLMSISGEQFKNIESCEIIWNQLLLAGADRKSVVINLGGGVVGDMGGFVASTFMRGIDFIQMPTTLLAMVDASIGGKLGVDFNGFKNLIGLFGDPQLVWMQSDFLDTLASRQLYSGFAEVIKHALISDKERWVELKNIEDLNASDNWEALISWNVNFKNAIVREDPFEGGRRKILNFGHSIGHAIESYFLNSNNALLHGEAVAWGMLFETHLSCSVLGLDRIYFDELKTLILRLYGPMPDFKSQAVDIVRLISHDKKNIDAKKLFVLLNDIGDARYNIEIMDDQLVKLLKSAI